MNGYLIDTNVISEYNREQLPHPGVVKWLHTTPEASQYVSVLTLAEIEKGILRKEESSGALCRADSGLRCTGCVMLGSSDRIPAR
jgi:predicted nucleic acid-binding protein